MKVTALPLCLLMSCVASFAEQSPKAAPHSPYTIGPAIRDREKGTLVIPVHYYWRMGKGVTQTQYSMCILRGMEANEIRSNDSFVTESHTGTQSVVVEFTVRNWKMTLGEDASVDPTLKDAKELKVRFKGSADGHEQSIEKTIPIVDFPESAS